MSFFGIDNFEKMIWESLKIQKGKTLFFPFVENPGEVSNFLIEDYDALLKYMEAETQRRKLRV